MAVNTTYYDLYQTQRGQDAQRRLGEEIARQTALKNLELETAARKRLTDSLPPYLATIAVNDPQKALEMFRARYPGQRIGGPVGSTTTPGIPAPAGGGASDASANWLNMLGSQFGGNHGGGSPIPGVNLGTLSSGGGGGGNTALIPNTVTIPPEIKAHLDWLMNPTNVINSPEQNMIAAENARASGVGGGTFSANQGLRLLDSERRARVKEGADILEPYLARQQGTLDIFTRGGIDAELNRQRYASDERLQQIRNAAESGLLDKRLASEMEQLIKKGEIDRQLAELSGFFSRANSLTGARTDRDNALLAANTSRSNALLGAQTDLERERLRQGSTAPNQATLDVLNQVSRSGGGGGGYFPTPFYGSPAATTPAWETNFDDDLSFYADLGLI